MVWPSRESSGQTQRNWEMKWCLCHNGLSSGELYFISAGTRPLAQTCLSFLLFHTVVDWLAVHLTGGTKRNKRRLSTFLDTQSGPVLRAIDCVQEMWKDAWVSAILSGVLYMLARQWPKSHAFLFWALCRQNARQCPRKGNTDQSWLTHSSLFFLFMVGQSLTGLWSFHLYKNVNWPK